MHPKFTLLVIENEELALQPIAAMACRLGHRVIKSEGSDLPIAMMNAWRDHIQAVVLDWTLSCVIYGGDLIAALHKIDPDVPFIIPSDYGEHVVRPLLPKSARCSFILKPFLSFDFENTLRSAFPKPLLRS